MKLHEEGANRKAARGFAKILAVFIILAVAAFGDIMYIKEMQRVFADDGAMLLFCYLGAATSFLSIAYLLLGKSVVFAPGAQMLAAWIVFALELIIIALNIMLVFTENHTGFMAMWAFISPATPVLHMLGVALIFFLDPEMKEKHLDMEMQSRIRQAQRKHKVATVMAQIAVQEKHLEYTVMGLESAVNSEESQARIAQHAHSMNDSLLTELSGKAIPKDTGPINSSYNDRYYGRR